MTRTLLITERAESDLAEMFDWLEARSPTGAKAWYLSYRECLASIVDFPESFGLAPEADWVEREIRQALFHTRRGNTYRILFEYNETIAKVLRVRGPGQRLLSPRELAD